MSWAMGGILAFGVFGLIDGIWIRAGESRTFYPRYRTNYVYRNGPFTLISGGIWLIAGAGTVGHVGLRKRSVSADFSR
jgi:hypothetical protein